MAGRRWQGYEGGGKEGRSRGVCGLRWQGRGRDRKEGIGREGWRKRLLVGMAGTCKEWSGKGWGRKRLRREEDANCFWIG